MEKSLKIGNYQCESEEEYLSIRSDLKKIMLLKEKYDCSDPSIAKKLLTYIEERPNLFSSVAGVRFINSLKDTIRKSTEEKYLSSIPEKIVVSDIEKYADITVSENTVTATLKSVDDTVPGANASDEKIDSSTDEYCIPLNITIHKPRNILYIIISSLLVSLLPYFALLENTDYYASEIRPEIIPFFNCLHVLLLFAIWMFLLGISEFSRISELGKEVSRVKKELESSTQDNDENSDKKIMNVIIGVAAVIGIVILTIIFPPIILVFMLIRAIMAAIPKLKWLYQNRKYFLYSLLLHAYLLGLSIIISIKINDMYDFIHRYISYPTITLCILFFILNFIIMFVTMRNHAYHTLRTISVIPIMIFMILLPFALVGIAAYAMFSDESNSGNEVAAVGVHEVEGHLRHLSNGQVVYVRPYLRTNPDGILTNNFSYRG